MMYKKYNVVIPTTNNEMNDEYNQRVWFVAKNMHLIDDSIIDMNMEKLIGYSFVHIKIRKYGHEFSSSIMTEYEHLLQNMFI